MKEPLRVPFEATEPDLAGPRLVHEKGREDPHALPGFCEELREARARGGYSVADAAHVLRIQQHYLEALEEGRFDQIPGTTYTIGFLRSYSGFLGLDPDELVDAFKREQGLERSEQRLSFPAPSDTSPKPKFWLILLVLVLAGLAYGGWQYQSTGGQIATDLVDDVSTRLTDAVGMGETGAPEETAAASQTSAVTAAAPADAAPATETAAETAVETAAAPAAPDVAAADLIPAAEVWDGSGPAEATDVAALEGSQAEDSPVQPPPAKVEAAAEATSAAPEPTAANEPVPVAEVAAPGEPAVAPAETPDLSSPIAAPLDLAVIATGGTSSATATAEEAVAVDEAQPGGSTDSADTVRADTVSDTPAPAAAEPELLADAGYVPKVYGRSNLDARVIITALDDSWVQVQGPDNELLLTRILHPGDTYRVPDRPGLVMVTGNAGGLGIQVDDAAAPALGPLGVVMRNIALDPDRLLAGTATGG